MSSLASTSSKTESKTESKKITMSSKHLNNQLTNLFNYKVATGPDKKIPVLVYLANTKPDISKVDIAKKLANKHIVKICRQLKKLDIACEDETKKLLLDSLIKIVLEDVAESVFTLARPAPNTPLRLIILGVTLSDESTAKYLDGIRTIGAHMYTGLAKNGIYNTQVYADPMAFKWKEWQVLSEGFIMAMHRDNITQPSQHSQLQGNVNNMFWHVIVTLRRVESINYHIGRAIVTVRSMIMSKDLAHSPNMRPIDLIAFAQAFIKRDPKLKNNINIRVYGPEELQKEGFGLLYGMGKDSKDTVGKSRMLILNYNKWKSSQIDARQITSSDGNMSKLHYNITANRVLIGNALRVTKDGKTVYSNMSNAASVLSAFLAYVKLKTVMPLLAIISIAEHTIDTSGTINSMNNGVNNKVNNKTNNNADARTQNSVFTSIGGKRVEIMDASSNYDYGGLNRIMKADCIEYAIGKWPRSLIIDIEQAVIRAVNKEEDDRKQNIEFMSVNIPVINLKKLVKIGLGLGQPIEEQSLENYRKRYLDEVKSSVSGIDVRNVLISKTGEEIPEVVFLSNFVDMKKSRWLHLKLNDNVMSNRDVFASIGTRVVLDYLIML